MTITKANLVEKISNRLGLSKAESQNLVENFLKFYLIHWKMEMMLKYLVLELSN